MRTIIVGCGRVGATLADRLDRAGHDVTVIDVFTEAFTRLPETFSGQAIRGDGTDEDVLRRAGVEGADNFFALTEGDNRNVLAAQLAQESLAVGNVVAKINDPVRADAYSSLGIGTICRTNMMVEAMAGFLGIPADANSAVVEPARGHHASHGTPAEDDGEHPNPPSHALARPALADTAAVEAVWRSEASGVSELPEPHDSRPSNSAVPTSPQATARKPMGRLRAALRTSPANRQQ